MTWYITPQNWGVRPLVVIKKNINPINNRVSWFLTEDVAEWIEHSAVHMMLKKIDEDEKLVVKVLLPGDNQKRNHTFLTEDGLYEVLMQSRKPIAKTFKKEVKFG